MKKFSIILTIFFLVTVVPADSQTDIDSYNADLVLYCTDIEWDAIKKAQNLSSNQSNGTNLLKIVIDNNLYNIFNDKYDWDLRNQKYGQLTFVSAYNDAGRRGFQIESGDINSDGHNDVVISGQEIYVPGRGTCGGAYVFFGPFLLNSSILINQANVIINGPSVDALIEGLAVGDVNGDGYDDIVLGAEGINKAYIVFGKSSLNANIDLSVHSDVCMIGTEGEGTGSSLAIGEINADGIEDIIIASPYGNDIDNSKERCGRYYAVMGRQFWNKEIDLTDEIVIYGADSEDGCNTEGYFDTFVGWRTTYVRYPGMQVVLGDLNNDGYDDICIGAPGAHGPNNDRTDCGEAYVVFGASSLDRNIYLASQADLTCYGVDAEDHVARLGTGDINGDGFDDLLIGARDSDGINNSLQDAGEIYVVYGKKSLPDHLDMATDADVVIYGEDAGDVLGRMVAKDLNGDGISDLLLGAPEADGPNNSRDGSGEAYLIFGYNLPKIINLRTYSHQTIYAPDGGDYLTAYGALALSDLDHDEIVDILLGACDADGQNNNYATSGEAYVISGKELTKRNKDVAVIKIQSPDSIIFQGEVFTPAVEVMNVGEQIEYFPVIFQKDSSYSETIYTTLRPWEKTIVEFPATTFEKPGIYTIISTVNLAEDENNTNDVKTKIVYVKQGPSPVIVYPNPFTPNNDGYNDYVEFISPELLGNQFEIIIFDERGLQIARLKDKNIWNGIDDFGKAVLPGAYFYIIKSYSSVLAKGVFGLAR